MITSISSLVLAFAIVNAVLAHPGHDVAEEAMERAEFIKRNTNTIRSCSAEMQKRGFHAAALSRRQALASKVRAKRGLDTSKPLVRRDFAAYNFTHASTKDIDFGSDETLLFADNSSCILQSDVTQGPYYVVGELIRSVVSEDQGGVPLYLDVQIIDTSTCEPVPALYMDFWHANATGVYSGVVANGNGNSDDSTNINSTFLRGIQQTDVNGVVQFTSVFPGHYDGRATHIHVLTHNPNATTVRTNSTLLSEINNATTHASHVGQIFFDQDLIELVSEVEPYASNTQAITLNLNDLILAEEADTTDPFPQWVLLNEDDVTDGILAWISIGIDPTENQEISAASSIYKDGGVANENSIMGGGDALDSDMGAGRNATVQEVSMSGGFTAVPGVSISESAGAVVGASRSGSAATVVDAAMSRSVTGTAVTIMTGSVAPTATVGCSR